MPIKKLTVVDLNNLNISPEDFEALQDHAQGDKYFNYYPDPDWDFIDEKVKIRVDIALMKAGLVFPTVNLNTFYVLMHFDD